jgi:hypothetical protein
LATGLNYSDALAGGVFMATDGRLGPILLVDPIAVPPLEAPVAGYLGTLVKGTQGYVFGVRSPSLPRCCRYRRPPSWCSAVVDTPRSLAK